MQTDLIKYISKYIEVSEAQKVALLESAFIKKIPKGTILLKEGEYSNECYFIFKGCIRSFFIKDGIEKTIEFYTEEQVLTPINYGSKTPSEIYLECLEETVATVGTPELESITFKKYPALESLSRAMNVVLMAKYQQNLVTFKTSNPEERYLDLLQNRADLLQRVSQHQIASYLGITPESLSRIRKRIMNK